MGLIEMGQDDSQLCEIYEIEEQIGESQSISRDRQWKGSNRWLRWEILDEKEDCAEVNEMSASTRLLVQTTVAY